MINTIIGILGGLMNRNDEPTGPVGPEAIITDYHERIMMEPDGKETTGRLIGAERIVEEGVFQSNAVAQLWFDLGKYGEYPVTLSLPDGPDDYCELELFLNEMELNVQELGEAIRDELEVPFKRVRGEWTVNWSEFESNE